jgi:hypothetical protein
MKKPARHNRPYTKTDMRRMRRFAANRTSARVTASLMGRSPGAVRYKAMMEGVRFRSINRKPRRR